MDLEKLDKFLKKEDDKVAWLALVSTGKPVYHHDWYTANTLQIFDGYLISRVVRGSDDNIYKVDCSIKSSAFGKPLYKASAFKVDTCTETKGIVSAIYV